MGTTITKKYIQDRIAARIATLDRIIEAGRAAEQELTSLRVGPMRKYLQDTEVAASKLDTFFAKLNGVSSVKDAEIPRLVKIVQHDHAFPAMPWRGHWSGQESRLEETVSQGTLAGVEKIKLQHAQAYLQEMPADEFSMTSIKSLGLLDAIKFRLEPEGKK